MKKKLLSLSLALLLSLSLLPSGLSAQAREPEPDPIPVVTADPRGPEKPGEPPADPQGKPGDDCLPDPDPIDRG